MVSATSPSEDRTEVTSSDHGEASSSAKAIQWIVGHKALHLTNQYLNNRVEQTTGISSSATTQCSDSNDSILPAGSAQHSMSEETI